MRPRLLEAFRNDNRISEGVLTELDRIQANFPVSPLAAEARVEILCALGKDAAGVYLVGRMFPFLAGPGYFGGDFWSSTPLLVVALVGSFTAFFAATIAFAQTDIKKVLAYSTISQLGFMFAALGAGAWGAAIFHLVTHAAFKALLFLASGSVIHGSGTQDLREMGGLWRRMPVTAACWIAGALALAATGQQTEGHHQGRNTRTDSHGPIVWRWSSRREDDIVAIRA